MKERNRQTDGRTDGRTRETREEESLDPAEARAATSSADHCGTADHKAESAGMGLGLGCAAANGPRLSLPLPPPAPPNWG